MFTAESSVHSFCQKCSLLRTYLVIDLACFWGTRTPIWLFWFVMWLMDPWAPSLSFALVLTHTFTTCFFTGNFLWLRMLGRWFSIYDHSSHNPPKHTHVILFRLPSFFSVAPYVRLWRAGWGWGSGHSGVRVGSLLSLLFSTRGPVGLLVCFGRQRALDHLLWALLCSLVPGWAHGITWHGVEVLAASAVWGAWPEKIGANLLALELNIASPLANFNCFTLQYIPLHA